MDQSRLRRDSEALAAAVTIPRPFSVESFFQQLGRERSRAIHQLPMALPTGTPCGLLVSTDESDFVIVEQRTSQWHQTLIALHEVGHLLAGDHRVPLMENDAAQLLAPHVAPEMVTRLLGRTGYSQWEEARAEMVGSLILERVTEWTPDDTWNERSGSVPIIGHVERSLHWRSSSRV